MKPAPFRLCLFPWHRRLGSHVPYKSQIELRAAYIPDVAWAVSVHPPSLSRKMGQPPVLTSSNRFSTLQQRFACARLSHSCLPASCSGFSATLPSRPREFHPKPLTDSGLETLASSGSCHHAKAVAFRRELELLLLPVGSLPTSVTCPLRSTSITPASSLLWGSPSLIDASVLSTSRGLRLRLFPS